MCLPISLGKWSLLVFARQEQQRQLPFLAPQLCCLCLWVDHPQAEKRGAFEPLQSCSGELVWWLLLGGWMWNKLGCAFGMEWWLVSCCSALDWPACEGLGGWASPPERSLSGSLRPRKGIGMFSTANTCFPWSGQAYLSIPWAQQTLRAASGWCEPVVCSNKLSVTESF